MKEIFFKLENDYLEIRFKIYMYKYNLSLKNENFGKILCNMLSCRSQWKVIKS